MPESQQQALGVYRRPGGAEAAESTVAPIHSAFAIPRALLVLIVATAVLTPAVSMTPRLPDLRVEQVLALPALGLLLAAWWRGTGPFRLGLIDAGFLLLAAATLLSTLYAPVVLKESFSPRDGYEVVKLGLYWVLYRFGLYAGQEPRARRDALAALFVAGAASALLALAQYFDWLGAGTRFGGWWAPAQHLRTLARDGRAFGTIGNPNYFGMLMALVAVWALAVLALRRGEAAGQALSSAPFSSQDRPSPPGPLSQCWERGRGTPLPQHWERRWGRGPVSGEGLDVKTGRGGLAEWPARCALTLAAGGVVLSGSRGALAALIVGSGIVMLAALLLRVPRWRALRPALLLITAFAVTIVLVEAFPRGRQDYLARVAGVLSPTSDSDFALRLERWRGLLGRGPAGSSTAGPGPAVADTGRPAADAAARARDTRRKADVRRIVAAVDHYRALTGKVPPGPSLDALVPSVLDALPADPLDGAPYRYQRTATGFTVTAHIEDPADPDYPRFTAGDVQNYIRNGDVEDTDGTQAAEFRALPGTSYQTAPEAALFGSRGIIYRGDAQHPDRRAAVYQQRHLARPGGAPYTASVWVKLPRPVRGDLYLYTNVYYADGDRQDPYARVAADPALIGVWQRLVLTITPQPGKVVDFIGVYLLSDHFMGEAYADGFELVDGTVPVTFSGLPEAGESLSGSDTGAAFRRSPLFGTGPGKAAGADIVDNEYLLVAARYGVAGLAAYLFLWGAVALTAVRRGQASAGGEAALTPEVCGDPLIPAEGQPPLSELGEGETEGPAFVARAAGSHTHALSHEAASGRDKRPSSPRPLAGEGWRAERAGVRAAPAIAVAATVAGLLVFAVVAGALYHLQLMGVFWPLAGAALATSRARPEA